MSPRVTMDHRGQAVGQADGIDVKLTPDTPASNTCRYLVELANNTPAGIQGARKRFNVLERFLRTGRY